MLKAIIFDFDGVIVDTELDRFQFIRNELKKYGYTLKNEDFISSFGKKIKEHLSDKFPGIKEEVVNSIISKRRRFLYLNISKLKMIPYIPLLVRFLSKKYILAITTGSQNIIVQKILQHHNLDDNFSLIVSGDDVQSSKPNPESFLYTLKKLGCKPEEVIIIEDSRAGIEAAKKAGCKVFALKNKYNRAQIKEADEIFQSHKEILNYFKSLK